MKSKKLKKYKSNYLKKKKILTQKKKYKKHNHTNKGLNKNNRKKILTQRKKYKKHNHTNKGLNKNNRKKILTQRKKYKKHNHTNKNLNKNYKKKINIKSKFNYKIGGIGGALNNDLIVRDLMKKENINELLKNILINKTPDELNKIQDILKNIFIEIKEILFKILKYKNNNTNVDNVDYNNNNDMYKLKFIIVSLLDIHKTTAASRAVALATAHQNAVNNVLENMKNDPVNAETLIRELTKCTKSAKHALDAAKAHVLALNIIIGVKPNSYELADATAAENALSAAVDHTENALSAAGRWATLQNALSAAVDRTENALSAATALAFTDLATAAENALVAAKDACAATSALTAAEDKSETETKSDTESETCPKDPFDNNSIHDIDINKHDNKSKFEAIKENLRKKFISNDNIMRAIMADIFSKNTLDITKAPLLVGISRVIRLILSSSCIKGETTIKKIKNLGFRVKDLMGLLDWIIKYNVLNSETIKLKLVKNIRKHFRIDNYDINHLTIHNIITDDNNGHLQNLIICIRNLLVLILDDSTLDDSTLSKKTTDVLPNDMKRRNVKDKITDKLYHYFNINR